MYICSEQKRPAISSLFAGRSERICVNFLCFFQFVRCCLTQLLL